MLIFFLSNTSFVLALLSVFLLLLSPAVYAVWLPESQRVCVCARFYVCTFISLCACMWWVLQCPCANFPHFVVAVVVIVVVWYFHRFLVHRLNLLVGRLVLVLAQLLAQLLVVTLIVVAAAAAAVCCSRTSLLAAFQVLFFIFNKWLVHSAYAML